VISPAVDFESQLLSRCKNFEGVGFSLVGIGYKLIGSQQILSGLTIQSGHLFVKSLGNNNVYFLDQSNQAVSFPIKISKAAGSGPGFEYFFAPSHNLALLHFAETDNRFVLYKGSSIPTTSDALRIVYQWLVGDSALPIHGGTISWGAKTALVSNAGGSGKSSLISSAVFSGAKTTGDDFGLMQTVKNSNQFTAWSQFQSFKLAPDSPSRNLVKSDPLFEANGKGIFSFESEFPGAIEVSQKIDHIIIPIIGDKLSSRSATLEETVKHVAISSSGMALERARTTLELVQMCRRTPSIIATFTRNSRENISFLKDLLGK